MNIVRTLGAFGQRICLSCVYAFLVLTSAVTFFVTALLPDYNYTIKFEYFSILPPLVIACLAVGLTAIAIQRGAFERISLKKTQYRLVFYYLIAGVIWVVLANVWPEWDPLDLMNAARQFGHVDAPSFEIGGYVYRFPYQIPLIILFKVIIFIFGDSAYLALELINVIAAAMVASLIVTYTIELTNERKSAFIAIALMACFFPLVFYCTFAYGNIISMPFLLLALLYQERFYKNHQVRSAILAALCASVSVLLKSSMLLVVAAMTFSYILYAVANINRKALFGLVILLGVYAISNVSLSLFTRLTTGIDTSQGLPKTAFVAMGLQATGETMPDNFGWYNGYLWSWNNDDYDPEIVSRDSVNSIRESIAKMVQDPQYAIEFFFKKYSSEWAEPTYESLLASNWSGSSAPEMPVMSERPMTKLLHSVYYGVLNKVILFVLDGWQTLVLVSALFFVYFQNRIGSGYGMGGLLFVAGTGLFYLFWEAQAQYVMPAYLILIPYAAGGLIQICDRVRHDLDED